MARNKPRKGLPEGDDGRTIVSMNVEGMPWYAPESAEASLRREAEKAGAGPERREAPLTREESWFFTWGALKAALLVVGVLCAGLVLFVLFCQHVWFR